LKELRRVRKALARNNYREIGAEKWRQSVRLTGEVASWNDYIQAGYLAAGKGFREVVNDIHLVGWQETGMPQQPGFRDNTLQDMHFDVVIAGGGVVGASIARELTRWNLEVAILEKEEDLACHTSGRNNGMIHPAFAPGPGTEKARYNVLGNRMFPQVSRELGVPVAWPGTLVLFPRKWARYLMPIIRRRAYKNGVKGMECLSPEKMRSLEPHLTFYQQGGLYFPEGGVVSPFHLTLAYGENAVINGARVFFNTALQDFELENHPGKKIIHRVQTSRGCLTAGMVINAAGLWADRVAEMADDRYYTIHPRRGAVAILDKKSAPLLKHNMGVLPFREAKTKGGGITPTIDGNVLAGPTSEETPRREDYATHPHDMENILKYHLPLVKELRKEQTITYFAGTRACTFEEDFIIEPSSRVDNLIHVAGIQSPGLSSVPAIARKVSRMAVEIMQKKKNVTPNPRFDPYRKPPTDLKKLDLEERSRLIHENPSYGRIVCRCEVVSEGEVVDSLHTPLETASLDGIKRRVRAGMGRCQGGFCTPRLVDILAREAVITAEEVTKSGPGSELVLGRLGRVRYDDKCTDESRGDNPGK